MPGIEETPLVVEESYRQLIRAAVKSVGGQRSAGRLADVHQTTVGRAMRPGHPVTYTTLRKLADTLPGLPEPVVSVRDADHERWCRLGAQLAEKRPEEFRFLLVSAERALSDSAPEVSGHSRPSDAAIDRLKNVIASPTPYRLARKPTR